MSRIGVICVHMAALPLGLVAAVPLAMAATVAGDSGRAIDLHFKDTMFVVAHFHIPALAAGVVLAVACAVLLSGSMNWLVKASWVCVFVHIVAAVFWSLTADDTVRAGE